MRRIHGRVENASAKVDEVPCAIASLTSSVYLGQFRLMVRREHLTARSECGPKSMCISNHSVMIGRKLRSLNRRLDELSVPCCVTLLRLLISQQGKDWLSDLD